MATKSKKYKIVAIQHLLKNNKIAKAEDIVDGSAFINLQKSIDGGFCEEVKSEKKKSKKDKKSKKAKSTPDATRDTALEATIKHLKTLNLEPLKDFAKEEGFELKSSKKDEVLAELIDLVTLDSKDTE